ncbi:MAG: hypothetical protein COS39_03380 [Hydrogenophilales bacterium CG03_land_8_20_14_0_80_62_28]|nr:diguanylate cyclase [Betaproteobacteria bacterium]PIV23717.1 MAG: hypothetical protein COS39_03380 [Hydrogenophilales bacterium CG03_land_8_20_14_0_80_62_28]
MAHADVKDQDVGSSRPKNRPSLLLPLAAGFATIFSILLLHLTEDIMHPGMVVQWLGGASQASAVDDLSLNQAFAVVSLFIALLAIAITTHLVRNHEAALTRKITQTEDTLDALNQGVIRIDGQGRVTYLNPAASKLLGENSDRLPDRLNLVDPLTRDSLVASLLADDERTDQMPLSWGARLITRQGAELEVEGTCRIVRDALSEIQFAVLLLRDVTEEREWLRRQPDLWDRDTLTTLPGSNFMISRLNRVLERERAGERPIAYLQIGFDGVQQVYRAAGKRAGDRLVRHLSAMLRAHIRDTDLLARMNDQEFGVLLTICPPAVADRIAADILAALSPSHFQWQGQTYEINARLGSIQLPPFDGSVEELLAAATARG